MDLSKVLAVLFGCIICRALTLAVHNLFFHPLRSVPGPLLACLSSNYMTPALIGGRRAHKLLALHRKYGSVVRVGPNEVSLSNFRVYRNIYSQKGSTKEESFYSAGTFLGHENIFSMRSKPQHAARRKMQSRPYSQQAINDNEVSLIELAERFVERIARNSKSSSSGTADVYPLCGLFSFEVICKIGFNTDICEVSEEDGFIFLKAMDDSAKTLPIDAACPLLKKYGFGEYVPGLIGHAFRQFKNWETLTRALFRGFEQDSKGDNTQKFMGTPLLVNEDAFLGRRLSEDEAVEEAMGIAFAGSGTTSTTLLYLLYNLSRPENKKFQIQLRKELGTVGKTLNDIKDLPYLNAVIKETMRLNPTIISTLPRTLDVPINVEDASVVLPKGTVVGMQNYVHHRDAEVYPDPDVFNPNRWIGVDASSDMEKALTPFSLGPRNCIGQILARTELLLATSVLFKKLDLSLNASMKDDDMEMEDRFNIAPRKRKLLLDVREL